MEGEPPAKRGCYAFPAAETMGLVWAYNGDAATELPHFHGYDVTCCTPSLRRARPCASTAWSRGRCSTNSVDIQHLRALHGLEIDVDPEAIEITDHNVEYDAHIVDPNLGPMDQHIKRSATNTIMLTGEMAGMHVFMGRRPYRSRTAARATSSSRRHRRATAATRIARTWIRRWAWPSRSASSC